MSYLINNLKFVGVKLFPKSTSKKLKDFNKTSLAKFLEMDLPTLSRWISGQNPMSRINLIRITRKLSEYFKVEITPEVLQHESLEVYLSHHRSTNYSFSEFEKYLVADKPNLLDEINFFLKKHELLQPIIFELLKMYDKSKY